MGLEFFSTYIIKDLRADVVYNNDTKCWGIDMFANDKLIKTEYFNGRSQEYAENAAENYVHGIKTI